MKGYPSENIFFFSAFFFYGPIDNSTCYQLRVFLSCLYLMAISLTHFIAVDANEF